MKDAEGGGRGGGGVGVEEEKEVEIICEEVCERRSEVKVIKGEVKKLLRKK